MQDELKKSKHMDCPQKEAELSEIDNVPEVDELKTTNSKSISKEMIVHTPLVSHLNPLDSDMPWL